MDEFFPLTSGSYSQVRAFHEALTSDQTFSIPKVTEFKVDNGALVLELENGTQAALANTRHFAGYQQGEKVVISSNKQQLI